MRLQATDDDDKRYEMRAEKIRQAIFEKSPEKLAEMAKDDDKGIRSRVAENEMTSPDTLTLLASDSDGGVRKAVACNKNTPIEAMECLCNDGDYFVSDYAVRMLGKRNQ